MLSRYLDRLSAGQVKYSAQFSSVFEQSLQSAVNLFAILSLALLATPTALAVYALGQSLYLVAQGHFRSTIILPRIYDAAKPDGASAEFWNTFGVLAALGTVGVLGIAGLCILSKYPVWGHAFVSSAVLAAGLLLQDFKRRDLIASGSYRALVQAGCILTALVLSGCVVLYLLGLLDALTVALLLTGSSIASYRSWTLFSRVSFRKLHLGLPGFWANYKANVAYTNAAAAVFAVYNSVLPIAVGVVGGPFAVAAFSSSRILAQPAWILILGLDNRERIEAARAFRAGGRSALRAHTRRHLLISSLIATFLAILGLIAISIPVAQEYLMRNHAGQSHAAIWLASTIVMAIGFPMEASGHVGGAERTFFLKRIAAAVATVIVFVVVPVEDAATRGILAYLGGWVTISLLYIGSVRA